MCGVISLDSERDPCRKLKRSRTARAKHSARRRYWLTKARRAEHIPKSRIAGFRKAQHVCDVEKIERFHHRLDLHALSDMKDFREAQVKRIKAITKTRTIRSQGQSRRRGLTGVYLFDKDV